MAKLDVTNQEKTALAILEEIECTHVNIGITGEIEIDVSELPGLGGLEETLAGLFESSIETRIPALIQDHCGGLIKDTLNNIMHNAKRRSELNPGKMTKQDMRDELAWMKRRMDSLEEELAARDDTPAPSPTLRGSTGAGSLRSSASNSPALGPQSEPQSTQVQHALPSLLEEQNPHAAQQNSHATVAVQMRPTVLANPPPPPVPPPRPAYPGVESSIPHPPGVLPMQRPTAPVPVPSPLVKMPPPPMLVQERPGSNSSQEGNLFDWIESVVAPLEEDDEEGFEVGARVGPVPWPGQP